MAVMRDYMLKLEDPKASRSLSRGKLCIRVIGGENFYSL
jgi:hypothetical protein